METTQKKDSFTTTKDLLKQVKHNSLLRMITRAERELNPFNYQLSFEAKNLLSSQTHCPGTYLLSPFKTIIGTSGLNCSVPGTKNFLNTLCWRLPTFAIKTIIGSVALNFSVRNGKRCDRYDKSPTQNVQIF